MNDLVSCSTWFSAFGWLYKNHPRTAIHNLQYLAAPLCLHPSNDDNVPNNNMSHGYWKDLLNILALATLDQLTHPNTLSNRCNFLHNYLVRGSQPTFKTNEQQQEWAQMQHIKRAANTHAVLTKKFGENRYRALYIAVSRLFADQLIKDSEILEKLDELPKGPSEARRDLEFLLSLAPKWAPTPGGSHDRVTNIASAICLLLQDAQILRAVPIPFVADTDLAPSSQNLHLLRSLYQKSILTPARRALFLAETFMTANNWSSIRYNRVPSLCMHLNKGRFYLHDRERFIKYLADVESGRKGIAGQTMMPHALVMEAMQLDKQLTSYETKWNSEIAHELMKTELRTIDAQWATLLARTREAGTLDNCIAVCDVSGSMGYNHYVPTNRKMSCDPIFPAISLSLLMARLAKPPFQNTFITFSSSPSLITLEPEEAHVNLGKTVRRMAKADWHINTNFKAVFLKLILPLAVANKVPQEDMIKRIFVFSDMQFDECTSLSEKRWKTNHDVIERAYRKAGYDMPEIVYWDLSNASVHPGITSPVKKDRKGVAMVSGYSPALLKAFMGMDVDADVDADAPADTEEEAEVGEDVVNKEVKPKWVMTPEAVMLKVLGRKSFEPLQIAD